MTYVSEAAMLRHAEYVVENVSTLFHQTREKRNLTLADAARQTGLSYNTLTRLERGTAVVNQQTMLIILRWIQRG